MHNSTFVRNLPWKACIFVMFVEAFNYIRFNIGGDIGLGDFCMLGWVLMNFSLMKKNLLIKKLFHLYGLLLLAQLISEIFVSNGLNDSIRGLMVTVMSFCHLAFLLYFFLNDFRIIIFGLLGAGLYILLLPNNFDETLLVERIIEGESVAYVKLRLAPALGYLLSAVAFFFNKRISICFFILTGFLLILFGARNGGLTFILSALATLYLSQNKIQRNEISPMQVILLLFVSYIFYFIYVQGVQIGFISAGNNYRVLNLNNPYNPLDLIYANRTEFFVGFHAFMDNFLLGLGAWAKDETGYYWRLMHKMVGSGSTFVGVWIPVHSVLMGWGVYHGILAFIAGLNIVVFLMKKVVIAIRYSVYNQYPIIFYFMVVSFIWNLLFSPPSHFRMILPMYMAVILVIYLNMMGLIKKTKKICK